MDFNYSSLGIPKSQWESFSPQVKSVVSVLGSYSNVLAQQNQALPGTLSKKTLAKLWEQATNDPTISKYYSDDLRIGTTTLQNNLSLMTDEFHQLTDQQKQQYIDAKKELDKNASSTGLAYSGFRRQAQKELDKSNQDVISSSRNKLKSQLNQQMSDFEQTYGTKNLSNLGVQPIGQGGTNPTGMQSNWTLPDYEPVSYTPIGGLAGTQSQQKLADVESQYEALIQQKSTDKQLTGEIAKYKSLAGMA